MSDIAIRVENLGKKYTIGANQARYQTVRESLTNAFHQSFRTNKGQKSTEENTIWALKDVNFEVKHGEVLGIIGRNGAGKSTLLKILARITKPTTGRIVLNGRVGSLLEVGTGFHPELTGRENIYLSGAILGMKRKEIIHKFDEIVDFAEIEKFLDTSVKHYSSGMYMRLAFAVAAHLEPEILLVDEVLAVGDLEFQKKCLGKMNDVASEGRTILFISHNLDAIKTICPKTMEIEKGKIKNIGESKITIERYINQKNDLLQPFNFGDKKFSIRLLDYYISDQKDNRLESITFRQSFIFNFVFSSKITGLGNILFRLNTIDGIRIASISGTEIGFPFVTYNSDFLVKLIINNNVLNPGSYYPEIYLSNPYQFTSPDFHTDNLPVLIIQPKPIKEELTKYYTSKHGWVYLDTNIEITNILKDSS